MQNYLGNKGTDVNKATCGRCGYQDDMRRVGPDGADVLPGAWTMGSVTTRPVITTTLCPTCTRVAVHVLSGVGEPPLTILPELNLTALGGELSDEVPTG